MRALMSSKSLLKFDFRLVLCARTASGRRPLASVRTVGRRRSISFDPLSATVSHYTALSEVSRRKKRESMTRWRTQGDRTHLDFRGRFFGAVAGLSLPFFGVSLVTARSGSGVSVGALPDVLRSISTGGASPLAGDVGEDVDIDRPLGRARPGCRRCARSSRRSATRRPEALPSALDIAS